MGQSAGNAIGLPRPYWATFRRTCLTPASLAIALNLAVLAALAAHFAGYLAYAQDAIRFPFELDYGEGIVWQQAVLMGGERMYGDISQFPHIVFHYPPLYHLAARAAAMANGDMLAAGRALSVACTLATGALVAAAAWTVIGESAGRAARTTGAAVAGLTVFCYFPVVSWSPLMRVDMLAMALTLLGVWLALKAARRPVLLYAAVLAFVAAVYTKQSLIAAPLAVLAVYGFADRRLAFRAFALGLAVGLIALAALTWTTGGGFLRHLLLYNLNRFSLAAAATMAKDQLQQIVFLLLAMYGMAAGWRGMGPWTGLARRLRDPTAAEPARAMAILTVWFALATAMLITLGKSGATLNYLIEWMCIWSIPIGLLVARTLDSFVKRTEESPPLFAFLVPAVLCAQIAMMPASHDYGTRIPERTRALAALEADIRAAPGPVLSDDMVLLMRAGKPVPWEPAIFAELASTGRWDERAILDRIESRAFAFVVTQGTRGEKIHDARYTLAVEHAIHTAYPRTERRADRIVHLPPR